MSKQKYIEVLIRYIYTYIIYSFIILFYLKQTLRDGSKVIILIYKFSLIIFNMDNSTPTTIINNNYFSSEPIKCNLHVKEHDITCFTCQKTLCSLCMCLQRHPQDHIYFSSSTTKTFPLKNILEYSQVVQTYIDDVNNSFIHDITSTHARIACSSWELGVPACRHNRRR